MTAYIDGNEVEVTLIKRGALGSAHANMGKSNIRPLLVRTADGSEVWVYDDEGDARTVPGDKGPARRGKYGWSY